MSAPMRLTIRCGCGQVGATISSLETAPPLRLVCYCKDCRGYYNTLNKLASDSMAVMAPVDSWGGVDWTSIYPRDIEITQGKDMLKTVLIRPESKMRQVYCGNCCTPLFRFGMMSVLMNTSLIQEKENVPDVRFRIMGRQALKGPDAADKPKMSWSVPLSWFWTMTKRVKKDLMEPMPVELTELKDAPVLEGFQEG